MAGKKSWIKNTDAAFRAVSLEMNLTFDDMYG
jgi:hypothetical protein